MYVKKICHAIIIFIIIEFPFILSGCTTFKYNHESDVIQHQRRITELEGRIENLTREIDRASNRIGDISTRSTERLKDIRGRSSEIQDSVDRIIYLFGEYESEVQRLLREIDEIRVQNQESEQNTNNMDSSTSINDDN